MNEVFSEPYSDMKDRQQKEVNAFPIVFAFSNRQFNEAMEKLGLQPSETGKILSIGAGGFIRKSDAAAFQEMLQRHRRERTDAIAADESGDGFIYQMLRNELANHEYGYTRDFTDALDCLGITGEQLAGDPRLLHAFHKACKDEEAWHDSHR